MATYKELQSQIEQLKIQAEAARRQEIASVLSDIRAKMVEYDITVEDLGGRSRGGSLKGSTVAPKYRDPVSGATWTGRGKPPRWMAEAQAQGKTRESFLIG